MSSPKKHRKRGAGKPGGSGVSRSFRQARDLIHSGRQAEGLAQLNRLAAESRSPARRARIALLIGASESDLSRHIEAAAAFSRAGQLARQAGDTALALQAGTGEIRALLRALQTDQAKAAAALLLEDLRNAQRSFDALADLTPGQLAARGSITLPPRPPRPTVALTGIANAFVQSGLTAEARAFLEKAVILSPNGASRARQLLARLALAADEPELAERHARESLQTGRFQAKTVAAWPLYLDARARQNRAPVLEPILLESLLTHAKGRILSASLLSIVRLLRAHGDDTWKSIARSALAVPAKGDPVILTEIEKILHADAKLTLSETPADLAARALKLFLAAAASPAEQIAHAKTHIRQTLEAGRLPDLPTLVETARHRFGDDHATAIRHTAALGAMLARRHDLARDWLHHLIRDLEPGAEPWGKALWALARMESLFEDRKAETALRYLELAANEQTPPRFRIQAMLRGFKYLGASGNPANSPEFSQTIRSILAVTDDYRILLDAARQLALAATSFTNLKHEAAQKGTRLADQAIAAATTPAEALAILEYLSRKLYWDLGNPQGLLARWDELPPSKKIEFQASGGSVWYAYLAMVFRSLTRADRKNDAISLASSVIDSDNATPEGYVLVGSEYAEWLLREGEKAKAYECFEWIARESPTQRKAATAHYWIALRAFRKGDQITAKASATALRACFSGNPSLLTECELDAHAILLLGLKDDLSAYPPGYGPEFSKARETFLDMDLNSL